MEPFSFIVDPDGRSILFVSTAMDMVADDADTENTFDVFLGGLPQPPDRCGDPVADASRAGSGPVKASDALFILRAAVGSETCEKCVCDVNDTGTITAIDALLALELAVGQQIDLKCPAC